jgi:hypothetical protein
MEKHLTETPSGRVATAAPDLQRQTSMGPHRDRRDNLTSSTP